MQEALSELLLRGVKDPRIGLVTVTGARMSPDLKHATVYVSVHGDAAVEKSTLAGLASARPYLQAQIGRRLALRFTPELRFEIDPTIGRAERLEELLREARTPPSDDDDA